MATATQYQTDEYVTIGAVGGKASKVERYGWILRDRPGEFRLIGKHDLHIDHEYQREKVIKQKVQNIQSNWSWAGCGAILVAMRADGTFWVFDGQHRVLAARNRADIFDLPCMVFEVDDKTQEAAGFLVANTERKAVNAVSKFKAMVMTKDPNAVAVEAVLRKLDMVVAENAAGRREIKCVRLCLKLAAFGGDLLELVLRAASSLGGDKPAHRDTLEGLAWLHRKHGLLSNPRFLKRFASMTREELASSVNSFAAAEGHRGDKVAGTAILRCVNKGLRQKFGQSDE